MGSSPRSFGLNFVSEPMGPYPLFVCAKQSLFPTLLLYYLLKVGRSLPFIGIVTFGYLSCSID